MGQQPTKRRTTEVTRLTALQLFLLGTCDPTSNLAQLLPELVNKIALLYVNISPMLCIARSFLPKLEEFKGSIDDESCPTLIMAALLDPTRETEYLAWGAAVNHAQVAVQWFEFVSKAIDDLGEYLRDQSDTSDPMFSFILRAYFQWIFEADQFKLSAINIQNNWAYYRRSARRFADDPRSPKFTEEMKNRVTLFYAYPAPHFKCCVDLAVWKTSRVTEYCIEQLKLMSQMETLTDDGEFCFYCEMFCIMDFVLANGVFNKKSPVNAKKCLQVFKTYDGRFKKAGWDNFQYLSSHLNDRQINF
jgi:hypothetical protein